ncbi:MAG TPA: DUF2155 domain-containing protein [Acetobacteraceae bacterium]|nr:DUF2155 domain-containing protein [Acetobacteraceae bacterium]
MRRIALAGLMLALPLLAEAQEPPQAPIVATPLTPPSVQYPTAGGGQGQAGQGGAGVQQQIQPGPGGPNPYPGQQTYPAQQPYQQQAPYQVQPSYQGQPGYPTQPSYQGQLPSQVQSPYPAQQPYRGQPSDQGQPGATGQTGTAPMPSQGPAQHPLGYQRAPNQPAVGQAPATGTIVPGQSGQPSAQGQQPSVPAPPSPNPWLPQGGAILQALDKVNAVTKALTVKDGQTVTFGSLSITVQSCLIRPPDMPQDAAAFLSITDSHADQPGFKGWMIKSDPSLSVLEHPLYDVRVEGCTK